MTNQPGASPGPPMTNSTGSEHLATARRFTEPLRETTALALVGANAIFLVLGVGDLLVVFDGWASEFGRRCVSVFGTFAGPLSLGLPITALLLATHVAPMVKRTRLVLVIILGELTVSAIFAVIAFLGAFAYDLTSIRATLEGLLVRSVWLTLLGLAAVWSIRVWLGLFPSTTMGGVYQSSAQPVYGQPYPGQPRYPMTTKPPTAFQPGKAQPGQARPSQARPGQPQAGQPQASPAQPPRGQVAMSAPSQESSWPVVPPPPMPTPRGGPTDSNHNAAAPAVEAPEAHAASPTAAPAASPTASAEASPTDANAGSPVPDATRRLAATTLELPEPPEPGEKHEPSSSEAPSQSPPPAQDPPSQQDGR